jgi:hypothetical protein
MRNEKVSKMVVKVQKHTQTHKHQPQEFNFREALFHVGLHDTRARAHTHTHTCGIHLWEAFLGHC